MSEQLDLVEALERVKQPPRNLYMDCLIAAYDWLDLMADGVEFTAGQLAEGAGKRLPSGKPFAIANLPVGPAEPRVWGAVMRELRRQRRIEDTGRISQEGRSHRGIARVWRVAYRR